MAAVTYEYILTGLGATIFAVDQQGYVYLNAPSVDADPPNPSSYELIVRLFFFLNSFDIRNQSMLISCIRELVTLNILNLCPRRIT